MDKSSFMDGLRKSANRIGMTIKKVLNKTEDRAVALHLSNTPPYKDMPRKHRERIVRIRRIGIDYKKEIDGAKQTGKTVVRVWIWYTLVRYPANLKPDAGFLLKLSAQALRMLAFADMVRVVDEWNKQVKK